MINVLSIVLVIICGISTLYAIYSVISYFSNINKLVSNYPKKLNPGDIISHINPSIDDRLNHKDLLIVVAKIGDKYKCCNITNFYKYKYITISQKEINKNYTKLRDWDDTNLGISVDT